MKFLGIQIGGSSDDWQPTLTGEELATIQNHEDWRTNGGTTDDDDFPAIQARYSELVEQGVYLEQVGENEEWRWNKQQPEPYEVEREQPKGFWGRLFG